MHHARIKLYLAFFVRQSPVADGIIVRIIFNNGNDRHGRIERVAALLENLHPLIKRMQPISARNKDRPRALSG